MSLLHRLMLLVCLALVPAALIEIVNELRLRQAREEEVRRTAERAIALIEAERSRLVEGVRLMLVTVAQTEAVRSGDSSDCNALLIRLRAEFPAQMRLEVARRDGSVFCSMEPSSPGQSVADRVSHRAALETGGFAAEGSLHARPGEKPGLPFAVPFHDRDGGLAGTVSTMLGTEWLRSYVASNPLPAGATLMVADRTGALLMRQPEADSVSWLAESEGSSLPDEYMPLLREPGHGSRSLFDAQGTETVVAYSPPGSWVDGLFIAVGIDKRAAVADIDRALAISLAIALVAFVLTLALAWWAGDRLLRRPIRALVQATRRWRAGDYTARTGSDSDASELGALARAFDAMAEDLQKQTGERELLHAREQKMAAILSAITDGVFEVDRGWRITYMNDRARALLTLGSDPLGRHLWDIYGSADAAVFADGFRHAMERQEPVEFEGLHPTLKVWLAVRVFPSRDGLAVFLQDITEVRGARAARELSDVRFRVMFEQAAVGIQVVDAEGRIIDVNGRFCAILGRSREELVGQSVEDLTEPVDRAAEEPLVQRLRDGVIPGYAIEKRYRRKDGRPVWVRVTSSLARTGPDNDPTRLAIVEDITGRKAMEVALRTAKEEAERANIAKTKFLAAASHDLRQPLQSLFFFTAALTNQVSSERGRTALMHLERGLDALKGLLDSLLDVSRLDAGMVTPTVEDFPIGELIEQMESAYAPVAAGRGLRWTAEPCRLVVRSDRTLLSRLVRNLVENALRYTEAGEIAIHCRTERNTLLLTVRDTGIGIPPDHLERIFEEFHQVSNPERDRQQGLGLGLAIVRRISRLLDHPITVTSEVGQGSGFTVRVPLGQPAAVSAHPPPAPPVATGEGAGCFAVLVDDDVIVLMGLHAMLKEWGYEVVAASSADQAMERLETEGRKPDIVIADYRLRNNRVGTEVIARVRQRFGPTIPGVILTGETGPECQRDADEHGLTVVHKPVTPRQLSAALQARIASATITGRAS